jgi:hypothetical protein
MVVQRQFHNPTLIPVIVIFLVLAYASVALRIWTRAHFLKRLGWDDYMIIATVVCLTYLIADKRQGLIKDRYSSVSTAVLLSLCSSKQIMLGDSMTSLGATATMRPVSVLYQLSSHIDDHQIDAFLAPHSHGVFLHTNNDGPQALFGNILPSHSRRPMATMDHHHYYNSFHTFRRRLLLLRHIPVRLCLKHQNLHSTYGGEEMC